MPARVVDEGGREIFTADDIMRGQEAFLTYGLMQFGSVYGHGAYLGPDFTADYLHRQAERMINSMAAMVTRPSAFAASYKPIASTRRPASWCGARGRCCLRGSAETV